MTVDTPTSVADILAEAKSRFGCTPFDYKCDYRRYTRVLRFFEEQSPDVKKALNDWVFEHGKGKSFGQLHHALRIVNGMSGNAVQSLIKDRTQVSYSKQYLSLCEKGTDVYFSSGYIKNFQAANPFDLSINQLDTFGQRSPQKHVKQCQNYVKRTYSGKFNDQHALLEEIANELAAYKAGGLPLVGNNNQGLMTRQKAMKQILAYHPGVNVAELVRHYPSAKNMAAALAESGGTLLQDEHVRLLALECGLSKDATEAILKLPNRAGHKQEKLFSDSVKAEMVRPHVRQIFEQTEQYESFGGWLRTLREAAQVSREEVGKKIGLPIGSINNYEFDKALPSKVFIHAIVEDNIYSLPTDTSGEIDPMLKKQLSALFENHERQSSLRHRLEPFHSLRPLDDSLAYFEHSIADRPKSKALTYYFKKATNQEMRELRQENADGAMVTLNIEGRHIGFCEMNGVPYLDAKDVGALAKDALFLQRLALAHEGAHIPSLGKPAVHGTGQTRP